MRHRLRHRAAEPAPRQEDTPVPDPTGVGQTFAGLSVRARTSEVAWRRAGDEIVVLDLAASRYHAMNTSGAILWELLADWTTCDQLADSLATAFGLSAGAARRDALLFLCGCADAELLETRAAP
jgi:Coenzyme PQQ synthesis protein D (PqqD)